MDYYNDYRDHQRPYGRHEDSVPDDIDGPPPPGYLFNNSRPPPSNHPNWAPPTFRGGPEYRTSPPRAFGSYPYSPERGRPRDEGGAFPQVFPRMEPPLGYNDYGGLPPYGSDFGHDYGQDYARGSSHGDYDYGSRPPGQVYPPDFDRRPQDFERDHGHAHGHGHGEFDRRGPPREEFDRRPPPREEFEHRPPPREEFEYRPPPREEFERRPPPMEEFERRPPPMEEFDRRPPPREEFERRPPPREEFERRPPPMEEFERRPPPPEVYPPAPPSRHVQFDTEVHVHPHPEDSRFDAPNGRPPPPFEPEPHFHGHEPHPPIPVERPRSPPRDLGKDGGGAAFIPPAPMPMPMPMPFVPPPVAAAPPPPQVMTHDRGILEPDPVFIPPMPFIEPPLERSPHHHGHGNHGHGDVREFPLDRGGGGAMPFDPGMGGIPPPFPPGPHYGVATEHGHVKRKHFEGCKDWWAGFLFLLHFWAVVGVCVYLGVRGVIKTNQNNNLLRQYEMAPSPAPAPPTRLYSIKHWAPQLATAAASGWVFAFVWQWLVRTRTMIKVCLSLGAVSTGLLGIILVSTGTAKGLVGLIFLVFALFQGLYVHLVRHRIPFAAIMLARTRGVVKKYKSLHLISMWTVFLAMFWLAVWIFGVSGAVSLPYGGWYAALLVISLAWSMEVLRNIVYVTVAGVVGQHYYEGHNHMPHSPVLRAYRRAWTISFGSVCLGSMFVAPVQTLHAIAKRLANEQGANEFLFSCVNCFLGVLDFFNKHFNKWAFVEVGLHSKSFVKSAKQTWHMFKESGTMLLINDDLTGAILLTSCIIGGVFTALVGGCWTFATHRYLTVGVSIISFCIGFFVTYLTLVVPESAIASYYVCFADDPVTLQKHDPPLWQYMRERKLKLDQEIE